MTHQINERFSAHRVMKDVGFILLLPFSDLRSMYRITDLRSWARGRHMTRQSPLDSDVRAAYASKVLTDYRHTDRCSSTILRNKGGMSRPRQQPISPILVADNINDTINPTFGPRRSEGLELTGCCSGLSQGRSGLSPDAAYRCVCLNLRYIRIFDQSLTICPFAV